MRPVNRVRVGLRIKLVSVEEPADMVKPVGAEKPADAQESINAKKLVDIEEFIGIEKLVVIFTKINISTKSLLLYDLIKIYNNQK